MPIQNKPDNDLVWLRTRALEDSLGTQDYCTAKLLEIMTHVGLSLPHTIGLFGSWGSGKTSLLAALEKKLTTKKVDVIYFNAYKYAGFMEVIPALIYKLIKNAPQNTEKKQAELIKRLATLADKQNHQFGEWFAKAFVGIDPIQASKDLAAAWKAGPPVAVLEEYYTKVDRIQDSLHDIYENVKDPIWVLIDELDRCDPGEAFEALKQLRILFNMRGLPFIFVVATNPDPIGLAIKHQYGLSSDNNEFESRCILEKFVDSAIDLSSQVSLGEFVRKLWKRRNRNVDKATFVQLVDSKCSMVEEEGLSWVSKNSALQAMSSANPLYRNLRLLEKTFDYVHYYHGDELQLWTIWHLTILKQADPKLRSLVARATESLKSITFESHKKMISTIIQQGGLDKDNRLSSSISVGVDSPFRFFVSHFWSSMQLKILQLKGGGSQRPTDSHKLAQLEALETFIDSVDTMNFLCQLCLIQLPTEAYLDPQLKHGPDLVNCVVGGDEAYLANFGWLLSSF
jgi:hypothetical protein